MHDAARLGLTVCIWLNQGTYGTADDADAGADASGGGGSQQQGQGNQVLHFFLFSRLANALMCIALVLLSPAFRKQFVGLAEVPLKFLSISFCGEALSIAGVVVGAVPCCQSAAS